MKLFEKMESGALIGKLKEKSLELHDIAPEHVEDNKDKFLVQAFNVTINCQMGALTLGQFYDLMQDLVEQLQRGYFRMTEEDLQHDE